MVHISFWNLKCLTSLLESSEEAELDCRHAVAEAQFWSSLAARPPTQPASVPLSSALFSETGVCSRLKLELWRRSHHLLRHTPKVLGFMLPWRSEESTCCEDEDQQASGV